jgi:hypothetical protein
MIKLIIIINIYNFLNHRIFIPRAVKDLVLSRKR